MPPSWPQYSRSPRVAVCARATDGTTSAVPIASFNVVFIVDLLLCHMGSGACSRWRASERYTIGRNTRPPSNRRRWKWSRPRCRCRRARTGKRPARRPAPGPRISRLRARVLHPTEASGSIAPKSEDKMKRRDVLTAGLGTVALAAPAIRRASAQTLKPLVVGGALPLTGAGAATGLNGNNGYVTAATYINEKLGGVEIAAPTYRIELKLLQDAS